MERTSAGDGAKTRFIVRRHDRPEYLSLEVALPASQGHDYFPTHTRVFVLMLRTSSVRPRLTRLMSSMSATPVEDGIRTKVGFNEQLYSYC